MNDWLEKKREQTRLEMEAGRFTVLVYQTKGLMEKLADELNITCWLTHDGNPEIANWTVTAKLPGVEEKHVETFGVFPSNELKAKLMLLRGK